MSEAPQQIAYQFLRDQARLAHLSGDGLHVNHLSALALAEFRKQVEEKNLVIGLCDIKWACILPLYWLLHDYMLREVDCVRRAAKTLGSGSDSLHKALHSYFWFVEQPLVPISDYPDEGRNLSFDWCREEDALEDGVLMTHLLELLWWHSRGTDEWLAVADCWLSKCPQWHRKQLTDTCARLKVQTRLTHFSETHARLNVADIATLPVEFAQAQLWVYLLNREAKELDTAVLMFIRTGRVRDTDARLVFDAHHWNRFFGLWGEPQHVGLTRRMLQATDSPTLLFHRLRQSRRNDLLCDFYRMRSESNDNARFDVLRFSMLEELAALRMWSWGDWIDAIRGEAHACFVICRWTEEQGRWAIRGLTLAVRSGHVSRAKESGELARALQGVELAAPDRLDEFVANLLNAYLQQKRAAWEVLSEMGDLIPENQWEATARWQLEYLSEVEAKKDWGPHITTLNLWASILPFVDAASTLWPLLRPEALRIASNPLTWSKSQFFEVWLQFSPIEFAKELGDAIAAATADTHDAKYRVVILGNAECRGELKGRYRDSLFAAAHDWETRIRLKRLMTSERAAEVASEAKPHVLRKIETLCERAVPPADAKEYFLPHNDLQFIEYISWTREDLGSVERVIETISNPGVMCDYLRPLFEALHDLIIAGPIEFATHVIPAVAGWLDHPPIARLTKADKKAGPLAGGIRITSSGVPPLRLEIGWAIEALLEKDSFEAVPLFLRWMRQMSNFESALAVPLATRLVFEHADRLAAEEAHECVGIATNMLVMLITAGKADPDSLHILAYALENATNGLAGVAAPSVPSSPSERFAQWLVNWLPHLSQTKSGEVREQTARLAHLLVGRHLKGTSVNAVLTQLRSDNRARVRHAANI